MRQESTPDEKAGLVCWTGALALAAAVRLYLLYHYYTINNDGIFYIQAARLFSEGAWSHALASFHAPLFPLMIAAAYPLVGDWELTGQMWSFILGILMLFPMFALLRRIYGGKAAMAALYLVSVSPYIARLSVEVRTEIPYIFFLLLALYWLQRGLESGKLPFLFLTGIHSALAYLLRPEGIGILIVGTLFLVYWRWLKDDWRRAWLQVSLLLLGFVLVAAPYILYLKWDTGSWLISRKAGFMLSEGLARYGAEGIQATHQSSDRVSLVQLILSFPLIYAKKVFFDFLRSVGFYFEALHYSYIPFLFLGWMACFREPFWKKRELLLLLYVAFYLAVFSLIYTSRRYAIPLATISLGWVGLGVLMTIEYCRKKWETKAPLLLGLLLLVFLAGTVPKTLHSAGWDKYYLRRAGLYLKEKGGDPAILSNNFRVAFYAEGRNKVTFTAEESRVRALIEDRGLDYLALDGENFESFRAGVTRQGWLLEKQFPGVRKEMIFIFRRGKAAE